ncbi:PAS domain S-box protein [Ramlibacter sp.]|uniref:PAS domain-containing sensor histidine kinase n=1 Tax=Ramlibacter sp. TaxID=1917967 RepID=UPI00179B5DC2|nr:PAS domain S-box protein [Ramlibacter sp.]MBA2674942.1 PAS domain S-box protein [Ramlibacter sp.]
MSSLPRTRAHRPAPQPANAARLYDASEQQFTSAFENAPIGMSLIAPDGQRLRVNRAFCAMLGYTQEELLERTVHDVTHPDDIAGDLRERGALLAGAKELYEHEKRYLHKDGRVLWGRVTCSLVRDCDGRPMHFIAQVQDITQHKHDEQALRESEERFRSLTMLSSDWYWEQDEALRFTSFSGAVQPRFWRDGHEEGIGKRRWEISGLRPLGTTWDEHRAVLERRLPFRDLQYVRMVDGEARYVTVSGEPVFGAGGRFTGYRGTGRDITASHAAAERLRHAEALLHMAAQIGRLGAWAWELGQQQVLWSTEVCAIHEVKPGFSPMRGQAVGFFAPEDQPAVLDAVRNCVLRGTAFDMEAQIVTERGRRVWVRLIGEPEWNARGRVRRIQGAFQDISESKRVTEQARLMAEQLSNTLESITDAFVTIDRDWRFTYLNGDAERLLRRPREELLGKNVFEELPNLAGSSVQHLLEYALEHDVAQQFEEEYRPANIWVQAKAYPSRQGLAIYVKDITKRVAAEREILRLNAELEERVRQRTAQLEMANKELEAFSYSIAHDLRAPLSSIGGFSQMLEEGAGHVLPERCAHYLRRIRAGVRQMGELTDGLLSLAGFSRASLLSETVDMAVLARGVVAMLREAEPQREVQIVMASTLPARGDPRLLAQVMGNLVGNAWKFTGRSEHARIDIGSTTMGDGRTAYFVRDNGAGFDMGRAERLFEAFQRMHSMAEFQGTGIGLAIVHKIVTRHGGRIWAESAPRRGAVFYFTLGEPPHA